MTLLKQIITEMLLLENVSINDINSAIDKHERILMDYHSVEDEDAGPRVVEVYAYGLTKAGNPVIRCFQPYGNTMTKVPAWKFFLISGIRNWKPTGQIFETPADKFNPNGDGTMSVVYNIASFDNENYNDIEQPSTGPKTNNNSSNVFKTDTEKRMARLRNQVNNPINISDLKLKQGFNGVEKSPSTTDDGPKTNNNTNKEIEQLRKQLGDTSQPIKMKDLQQKLMKDVPADDVFKTDTEKRMDKLRQQLNNPQKIDLNNIPKK